MPTTDETTPLKKRTRAPKRQAQLEMSPMLVRFNCIRAEQIRVCALEAGLDDVSVVRGIVAVICTKVIEIHREAEAGATAE